jgi:hypothetical protein
MSFWTKRIGSTDYEPDFEALRLSGGCWEDMRFPATRTLRGANSKPDFDYTNLGLLFPSGDTTEKIYISDQMPHAWVQEGEIRPHIHYVQDEAALPTFKLSYRIYNNGDAVPDFQTMTTTTAAFPYTEGAILQILLFPAIQMGDYGTSAWFDMILYREDEDVVGDVLFKGFDFHYPQDSFGSREEYIK